MIDGNNLLGSWGGPQGQDDRRAEVVRRVAAFCARRGPRATLVFDGHPLRPDMEAQDLGPLRLRVPPRARTPTPSSARSSTRADRPAELIVVTSDKALYSYVKTAGRHGAACARMERARAALLPRGGGGSVRRREAGPGDRRRRLAEEVRRGGVEEAQRPYESAASSGSTFPRAPRPAGAGGVNSPTALVSGDGPRRLVAAVRPWPRSQLV